MKQKPWWFINARLAPTDARPPIIITVGITNTWTLVITTDEGNRYCIAYLTEGELGEVVAILMMPGSIFSLRLDTITSTLQHHATPTETALVASHLTNILCEMQSRASSRSN